MQKRQPKQLEGWSSFPTRKDNGAWVDLVCCEEEIVEINVTVNPVYEL